jgi:hypothetical protein
MQKIFVQFPSKERFEVLANEFEAIDGIPHMIGAINL